MRYSFLTLIFLFFSLCVKAEYQSILYLQSDIDWRIDSIDLKGINEVRVLSFYVNDNGVLLNGISSSEDSFDEFIQKVKDLKETYPDLKISISVDASNNLSKVINNSSYRKILVENIKENLIKNNFDGVAIKWEYPLSYKDKTNFKVLLKELKYQLDLLEKDYNKNYLLSHSIPMNKNIINYFDFKDIVKYIDYIEIYYYDHTVRDKKTSHFYNLFLSNEDEWSIEKTVNYLKSKDISIEKIVITIPSFGKKFSNVEQQGDGLYNILDSNYVLEKVSYSIINNYYLPNDSYKKFKSLESNSSYLFNVEEGIFITFLDNQDIDNIKQYVVINNLYGISSSLYLD